MTWSYYGVNVMCLVAMSDASLYRTPTTPAHKARAGGIEVRYLLGGEVEDRLCIFDVRTGGDDLLSEGSDLRDLRNRPLFGLSDSDVLHKEAEFDEIFEVVREDPSGVLPSFETVLVEVARTLVVELGSRTELVEQGLL